MFGWLSITTELELPDFSSLYMPQMVKLPAAPYVQMLSVSVLYRTMLRGPVFQLSDGDIAVVAADPARTQRYTELVTHCIAPALRRIVHTVATQVRCDRGYEVHISRNLLTPTQSADPTVRQRHLYDSFSMGELSAVRLAMGGKGFALQTAVVY
jgi:hypothetical protein